MFKGKYIGSVFLFFQLALGATAQSFMQFSSMEGHYWMQHTVLAESRQKTLSPDVVIDPHNPRGVFKAWGTCFNEMGWDALNILNEQQQDQILDKLFSPKGDLKFTLGRIPMNANDYARDWYSCDETDADFELKYFNISRDEQTLIPYIKAAQAKNPALAFWISPWSPPAWMKINHNYAVLSDAKHNNLSSLSDAALFQGSTQKNDDVFPKQLAVNDYLIQDPRYLNAYADYFCRFISAYKSKGIPIHKVMYQNEAYSYTIYPGCAWTTAGSIRFNGQYLGPALKHKHPEISLYLGTINTNRFAIIDSILADPLVAGTIKGVGFQWEGRQLLPAIRKKYPQLDYVQTESECGWGSFNWDAAEHTFDLINFYLGNGCTEYTFWNAILADEGLSGWGWKQNALIRIDSKTREITYTPEYYAVKHYTHFISPGSKMLSFTPSGMNRKPILTVKTPEGKYVVIAGNFSEKPQQLVIQLDKKQLLATLMPHSLNTYVSQ